MRHEVTRRFKMVEKRAFVSEPEQLKRRVMKCYELHNDWKKGRVLLKVNGIDTNSQVCTINDRSPYFLKTFLRLRMTALYSSTRVGISLVTRQKKL